MPGYWNANSDLDWYQGSAHCGFDPPPTPEEEDAMIAEIEEARAHDRLMLAQEWDNIVGGTHTVPDWATPLDWRARLGWGEEAWDKQGHW